MVFLLSKEMGTANGYLQVFKEFRFDAFRRCAREPFVYIIYCSLQYVTVVVIQFSVAIALWFSLLLCLRKNIHSNRRRATWKYGINISIPCLYIYLYLFLCLFIHCVRAAVEGIHTYTWLSMSFIYIVRGISLWHSGNAINGCFNNSHFLLFSFLFAFGDCFSLITNVYVSASLCVWVVDEE